MPYRFDKDVYRGSTSDVLLAVEHLAKQMVDADLREVELYLPIEDNDATIRMKR